LASDGLLDNVYTHDILTIINQHYLKSDNKAIAEALAEMAFKNGNDPHFYSPFALHAQQHRLHFEGGKLDDITVVLATITFENKQKLNMHKEL
jgi:serine/threonine protein phosphatase PrpC